VWRGVDGQRCLLQLKPDPLDRAARIMNWEAIGEIGEVVGAVAVVITLVFLILQLRQNTFAIRQQSARESTSSLQQVALLMGQPAVAGTVSKVYSEADPELTASETAQVESYCLAYLLVYQQDYLDTQRGLQPRSLWKSRLLMIEALFVAPWVRTWWRRIGYSYFGSHFRELIERILSEDPRDEGAYWKPVSDFSAS
jgi:hypothetical protein